jgi:hypothetical protein
VRDITSLLCGAAGPNCCTECGGCLVYVRNGCTPRAATRDADKRDAARVEPNNRTRVKWLLWPEHWSRADDAAEIERMTKMAARTRP